VNEKLMELYELASNEQDQQKLKVLLVQISVLLEAKETAAQREEKGNPIPGTLR